MQKAAMLPVVFYQTAAGAVPVLEWVRGLGSADRKKVGLDLLRVQENWPIGMPVCKSLGGGLWEVRSSLTGGRIARLIFCIRESEIFVLHGFMKTTQKTPTHDLALAHKRMKEVLK
ncbi:MAG: type II toxin-antitoxin system RelE/ParE family toxin [Aestuariivirga sp.]